MFGGDVTYERLWRRLLQRYGFMRFEDIEQSFEHLYERSSDLTYCALKSLGEQRHRFEASQVRAFLSQLHLLVDRDVVNVEPESLLEAFIELKLDQAQRWFQFGYHGQKNADDLKQYLEQDHEQSEAVLAGLKRGISGHDVERILRYYADALEGPGHPLKFLPSDSTARRDPEVLSLPDTVAAYPKEKKRERKENSLHFSLYKWLIIHEQSHRRSGIYQSESDDQDVNGREQLVEWLQNFADPFLAETLFHLFEDVRIEANLKHQYPGFAEDRERLMALEYLFRPEPSGRERFLETLLQKLHWGKSHIKPPKKWQGAMKKLLDHAQALTDSAASVEDVQKITTFGYDLIAELFDESKLDEPLPVTLLPHEPLLELDPFRTSSSNSAAEMIVAEQPDDDPDLDTPEDEVEGEAEDHSAVAIYYDEWDFREGAYKSKWCALREHEPEEVDFVTTIDAPQLAKVRRAFEWMAEEDWAREKQQLQGDEIDLDAWIGSIVDRKAGLPPPEKLYTQLLRNKRDLCAVVLLDQSDSTARLTPSGQTVIQIEREALRYLCEALEALRDEYAIYTYSGDGHQHIDCYPLKKFGERYGLTVQRRLEALQPMSQNRDGCALRHATQRMLAQDSRTKLLLHITDGRPWDHGYTQKYALEDTKKAIQEARSKGIKVFGVICDPHAPDYVKSTYGPGRSVVVHSVDTLSDLLLGLYRRITW
jgi:hypothetical protein